MFLPLPPFTRAERASAEEVQSAAVARARAFAPEYRHRHYLDSGKGLVEHRHEVRSTRHGHPGLGLLMVNLTWIGWGWNKVGGSVLYVGTVAVFVGFAAMWLVGAWFFAQKVAP